MKAIFSILGCAVVAHGHYSWVRIGVNDKWLEPLKYIRQHPIDYNDTWDKPANDRDEGWTGRSRPWVYPVMPGDSPESIRCHRDNMASAPLTDTLEVQAGDNISFVPGKPESYEKEFDPNHPCFPLEGLNVSNSSICQTVAQHGGPVSSYLSPVPKGSSLATYDGSGPWIKISQLGWITKTEDFPNYFDIYGLYWEGIWADANKGYKVQIPPKTPPGDYLLRFESLYPRNGYPKPGDIRAHIYPACAHVRIRGPGGAVLPEGVRFPEALPWDHPGLNVSWEMEYNHKLDKTFVFPGGEVWDGN